MCPRDAASLPLRNKLLQLKRLLRQNLQLSQAQHQSLVPLKSRVLRLRLRNLLLPSQLPQRRAQLRRRQALRPPNHRMQHLRRSQLPRRKQQPLLSPAGKRPAMQLVLLLRPSQVVRHRVPAVCPDQWQNRVLLSQAHVRLA